MLCVFPSQHPFSAPLPHPPHPLWSMSHLWSVGSSGQIGLGGSDTQHPCTVWHVARCFSDSNHPLPFPFSVCYSSLPFSCFLQCGFQSVFTNVPPYIWILENNTATELEFCTYLLHWGGSSKNIRQKTHNTTCRKSKSVYGSRPGGPSEQVAVVPKSRGVGCACQAFIDTIVRFYICPESKQCERVTQDCGFPNCNLVTGKWSQHLRFESCAWNKHSQQSHWGLEKRS